MSSIIAATAPPDVLMRVAAINFSATVYDTDDLSTIRGASLILLNGVAALAETLSDAFKGVTVETVESGASVLILSLQRKDGVPVAEIEAATKNFLGGSAPASGDLRHFCFAVTFDRSRDSILKRISRLEARAAFAQYRTLSVPLFDKPSEEAKPSVLSRTLPGSENSAKGRISKADHDRHAYGRAQRSRFYKKVLEGSAKGQAVSRRLEDGGLDFIDSLGDLRAQKVGSVDLPLSLHGKIALLHLDGNGFGKTRRERLAEGRQRATDYSDFIKTRQADLLATLLDWAMTRPGHAMIGADGLLKLETLLWGGDEMVFALPAHAGWDVARLFAEEFGAWRLPARIDKKQRALTHGIGLLFANHKTPIRQLRLLVEELTDDAKALKDINNVQAFALESVDAPDGGLDLARARLYGLKAPGALHLGRDARFDFLAFDGLARKVKARLPRSLAMSLALSATGRDPAFKQGLAKAHESEEWEALVHKQLKRVLPKDDAAFVGDALFGAGAPGYSAASRAAPLLQLLNLWDYMAPLDAAEAEAAA